MFELRIIKKQTIFHLSFSLSSAGLSLHVLYITDDSPHGSIELTVTSRTVIAKNLQNDSKTLK